MSISTLSLGPLVFLGSQQGPMVNVTVDGCEGYLCITLPEWTALTALVDVLAAADKRHAADQEEIERLRRDHDSYASSDFERQLDEARTENANLRELIAASKECAEACDLLAVHEDNERYRTAFKQITERIQSGDHTVRSAFCSWCRESWPHLDGETAKEAQQYAREHAFKCKSHPLRIERDAVRARLDQLQPLLSVLDDWDWGGIADDWPAIDDYDDAIHALLKAMAEVERSVGKEQGK